MNGQAASLKTLASATMVEPRLACPFIVVTGGKGGVGKTAIAANLATLLSALGKKTLLIDLDLGLANLDVLFRAFPQHTLQDVAFANRHLAQCIMPGPHGISFVPGVNGAENMATLDSLGQGRIMRQLAEVSANFDFMLADTAAGIAPDVLSFSNAASLVVIVTTPDPAAITDAYALLKLLVQKRNSIRVALLVNQAISSLEAVQSAKKLQTIAQKFLHYSLEFLGWLPRDYTVARASREQSLFVVKYRDSIAAGALRHLSQNMLSLLAKANHNSR